jgi:hypothetical protein
MKYLFVSKTDICGKSGATTNDAWRMTNGLRRTTVEEYFLITAMFIKFDVE